MCGECESAVKIDVNAVRELAIERNEITPEAQAAIVAALEQHGEPTPGEAFSWQWQAEQQIDGATLRGKLPKRLAQWLYKAHGVRLGKETLTAIGNLAASGMARADRYLFRFVDRFDWRAGDFGDHGSCFWGSNEAARELMRDNGVLAVQFADPDEVGGADDFADNGIARAWLAPIDDGGFVIFNGYGDVALAEMASVLAKHFGLRQSKIGLRNNGAESGLLYINSGAGYHLADEPMADGAIYDFGFDDRCYGAQCCHCGDNVDLDCEGRGDDYGNVYCDDCYGEQFGYCECCEGDWIDADDIVVLSEPVTIRRRNWSTDCHYLCRSCADNYLSSCEGCGEYVAEDDAARCDKCGDSFCSACADLDQCSDCGDALCESCNDLTACESCGDAFCGSCDCECTHEDDCECKCDGQQGFERVVCEPFSGAPQVDPFPIETSPREHIDRFQAIFAAQAATHHDAAR